jgi:hypothetical protein
MVKMINIAMRKISVVLIAKVIVFFLRREMP